MHTKIIIEELEAHKPGREVKWKWNSKIQENIRKDKQEVLP